PHHVGSTELRQYLGILYHATCQTICIADSLVLRLHERFFRAKNNTSRSKSPCSRRTRSKSTSANFPCTNLDLPQCHYQQVRYLPKKLGCLRRLRLNLQQIG